MQRTQHSGHDTDSKEEQQLPCCQHRDNQASQGGGSCGGRQHRTSVFCNKYIITTAPCWANFYSWARTGTFVVLPCMHPDGKKSLSHIQMRALGHSRATAPDKGQLSTRRGGRQKRRGKRRRRSRQGGLRDKIHVQALLVKAHIKSEQSTMSRQDHQFNLWYVHNHYRRETKADVNCAGVIKLSLKLKLKSVSLTEAI